MKVLLAEDSLTMRKLLAGQLKRWDYDVTEVENGAQAWETFQTGEFWLVLTDWLMPEMDGVELIKKIRGDLSTPYVYTILLTSQTGNENLVEAMEAGADDFIAKPCDPNELRVRLRAGQRIVQLEQTLIQKNEQLKQTQAALVQTEKLAGVGQLAAGMAHEINNPIAYVSNNLAVLQRDVQGLMSLIEQYSQCDPILQSADPERAEAVKQAVADCDLPWLEENLPRLFESSREGLTRVREIVSNLRDFAHLDEADTDSMDIALALESTLKIMTTEFESKNLTVHTEFDSGLYFVCQPGKMKQVFHSILHNAVQASEPGGRIDIRLTADEHHIFIAVADKGHGMDRITQKKLFEPFYTTRPVGSGQGLGLAISYGVIEQHRGRIEFETAENAGTTFTIILPRSHVSTGSPSIT
jgi:two-component system NtrC family sensor kinase